MPTRITAANIQPGSITPDRLTGDLSSLGGGPKITMVSILDGSNEVLDDTAVALTGGKIRLTGSGFATGCVVIVGTTNSSSTTVISSNFVDAVVPPLSAGTYPVYLVNPDGGVAIRVNGITYSSTPTWITGSVLADQSVDKPISIQLSATSDSVVSYSVAAGSTLPPGLSLSSTGLLSGTITGISDETVYSFTLLATDQELQDSPRTFSLTVGPMINSNTHGWFGGGVPVTATVDRITFANDTLTAAVRGPLSSAKNSLSATVNDDFGWFGGGIAPAQGPVSTVDRITFAADTGTASVRGPLSSGKNAIAATGNDNFGWFGDGQIDRITFANDTSTASVRGPLSSARYNLAATGDNNYGWFGAGYAGPAAFAGSTTVDRITFAADTGTASVRGPLSLARTRLDATGNDNFGWFGGGLNRTGPSIVAVSIVDRITFAADTATASVRGPLSSARHRLAVTGNDDFGWFGGGVPTTATIQRIDFAADTTTASVRGLLSGAREDLAAA